ncbi:hypothetical protein ACQP3L_37650, partial [Escherichia coli]
KYRNLGHVSSSMEGQHYDPQFKDQLFMKAGISPSLSSSKALHFLRYKKKHSPKAMMRRGKRLP